uniref:Uncharacterized protein n=1 Tax=Steinernema glaseri TaxID=37863 RepID=A0A1I7YZS8_9BILA
MVCKHYSVRIFSYGTVNGYWYSWLTCGKNRRASTGVTMLNWRVPTSPPARWSTTPDTLAFSVEVSSLPN